MLRALIVFAFVAATLASPAGATDYTAGPQHYLLFLRGLQPGDTLLLAPGEYAGGLPVHRLTGTAAAPIRIRAANPAARPRFIARIGRNTVSVIDSMHVEIADLDLDGRGIHVDAVKAEGSARFAHHITLSNLRITGHGANQQNVAISTKCPAAGWVVRGNEIIGAGTGMYFGNSDGSAPFVGGTIEHNLVVDSIGYNLQIKHQNPRPTDAGLPEGRSVTVIRHNVFSKARGASAGELARPNVLVGHAPLSGAGSADRVVLYANLFHANPTEALFQGEGHLALYGNVFVNRDGSAIHVQPHHAAPGEIEIFGNTVLASGHGIRVLGGSNEHRRRIRNNVVFADLAIVGGEAAGNLTGRPGEAAAQLRQADGALEILDLRLRRPMAGTAMEPLGLPDADRDYCGTRRPDDMPGAFAQGSAVPRLALQRRHPADHGCGAGKP
jgi:hypothetical protein